MASILRTDQLCKSYGSLTALREVSFEVPSGSVFGVLGPNGSGKTTLLGTVMHVLYPSAGRFFWFDSEPVPQQRQRIGTLLETPNFYPYLTGAQNLEITASIRGRGLEQVDMVLEQVGLQTYATLPFSKYSLGMKQRLAIGSSLLGNPEVLVLDEPTNGLDPAGIADIRRLITELHQQGKTLILASHLLDEVEKVCTHVAILKKGRLLETGSMREVLHDETIIVVGASDLDKLRKALESYPQTLRMTLQESGFRLQCQHTDFTAESVNRHCQEKGVFLSLLHTKKRDLESRFLELTDE